MSDKEQWHPYTSIALTDWRWLYAGTPSNEVIQTAALVYLVHEARNIGNTLRQIQSMMMSLGGDGIHDVIKDAAKVARARENTRRQRNRRLRLARKRATG